MNRKILIIDDDQRLNQLLKDYLGKFGFEVATVTLPSAGLRQIRQDPPDLVILDLMLPEMDGFEVCREIRQNSSLPIIMLTARGDVTDRVVGLEMGADDYLPKPFEPRELVARIQSVLRRGTGSIAGDLRRFGNLSIDLNRQMATLDGEPVELTSSEFAILKLFLQYPGRVLSRDTLIDQLRGLDWDAFSRSVDVLISRLRQKLQDNPKQPMFIKTVWGSGYMFIAEEDDA